MADLQAAIEGRDIYTPPHCKTLAELGDSQIRLGIQGAPFTGKTTSSLTFPNPIILSLDRKVSAHCNGDTIIIPFHDMDFVDKIVKRPGVNAPHETKEAVTTWLSTEGLKLKKTQTLILDGGTSIEEAFHVWYDYYENELAMTKSGMIDNFVQWKLKKSYYGELFATLKSIPCNVIYIVHETEKSDKDGQPTGKLRPLMTGQVCDKLAGNFTDWFRSIVVDKPSDKEQSDKLKAWAGIDDATLKEWIASTPPSYKSIHLWQTQGDSKCDCGTSSLVSVPKYIVANYSSFGKYNKRNIMNK